MDPAKEVGGDFYDFFLIDPDHLAVVMADVSGKGVPAALFMVIAKTLIKNRAQMGVSPAEVLAYTNEQLCYAYVMLIRMYKKMNIPLKLSDTPREMEKKVSRALTENEIDTLALSSFCLACELSTRFLDDYIMGDKYFKIKSNRHNLERTRCQIALAKDMLRKMDAMNAIVRECAARNR